MIFGIPIPRTTKYNSISEASLQSRPKNVSVSLKSVLYLRKMIKVPPQIMTSYDRIANERPVYTVIDQW